MKAPKPASWVIIERATGHVVMETFNEHVIQKLKTEHFKAVPIGDHLANLNKRKEHHE